MANKPHVDVVLFEKNLGAGCERRDIVTLFEKLPTFREHLHPVYLPCYSRDSYFFGFVTSTAFEKLGGDVDRLNNALVSMISEVGYENGEGYYSAEDLTIYLQSDRS